MSRKSKIIPLSTPISVPGLPAITMIKLLEPTAAKFFELGPLSTNFMKSGVISTIDLDGVLLSYFEAGCIENVEFSMIRVLLADMSLTDGIRVRREFAAFFDEAIDEVLAAEAIAATAALASLSA